MSNELTFLADLHWEEVFANWEKAEKGIWDEYFTGEGYSSWREWRGKLVAPIRPENREWNLYRIEDPFESIPKMWIGGFRGWRQYLPEDQDRIQFKEMIKSPLIKQNPKIMGVYNDFPSATTILGIRLGEEIILGEGMHRCTAVALKAAEGGRFDTMINIALTDFNESERELFDQCRTQQKTGTFLDDLREIKV